MNESWNGWARFNVDIKEKKDVLGSQKFVIFLDQIVNFSTHSYKAAEYSKTINNTAA